MSLPLLNHFYSGPNCFYWLLGCVSFTLSRCTGTHNRHIATRFSGLVYYLCCHSFGCGLSNIPGVISQYSGEMSVGLREAVAFGKCSFFPFSFPQLFSGHWPLLAASRCCSRSHVSHFMWTLGSRQVFYVFAMGCDGGAYKLVASHRRHSV